MKKVYYTIESSKEIKGKYVLWKNTEIKIKEGIGSYGCFNVFRGLKKDIKKYCKDNKIKVWGEFNGCFNKT